MNDIIIITGGAGFIGCAVSEKLIGQGYRIIAVDNLHPQIHPMQKRPDALHPDVELVVADVCDADFWDGFLVDNHPHTVVHLAAETGTSQSLTESNRHAMVNVVGTTQMLDAFTRHDAKPQAIVLSSSRAVYGEGMWRAQDGHAFYPDVRSHQQLSSAEWDFSYNGQKAVPLSHRAGNVMPNPSSIYGSTKLAQEHIIKSWCAAMQVSASILRFQNVYGPGQSPFNPYTGIINLFHRAAYAKLPIQVYEDGVIGRDFVYIDDVADSVVASILNPADSLRLLDVGSGNVTTILEAATLIAALHGAPEPVICGKFRDGDIRWAVADADPLDEELGVRAKVDFASDGAKLVGEWLLEKGYME
ncbi:NAD-dependent epimerase/dehydratase family protein [Sphingobium xenophagum]|uniref:NAD-dependent epimerase/dehydratase family protein n=1 Tax=Sphingobium xenophagum TaxID=121428 RepID=UPI0003618F6B|nr:NAD-dependent epimerase/dehydratase family protein [Sphingobium xenophagum]